jgi:hypothetical protein
MSASLLWKDPEFRARNAAAIRKVLSDRWKDPEFRARNAAASRKNWKDPEFRARNAAAINRRLREEAQAIVAALEKRTGRRVA